MWHQKTMRAGGSAAAQGRIEAGVVPPFHLHDVGIGSKHGQPGGVGDDLDRRAGGNDGIGEASVAGLFQKGEVAADVAAVTGGDLGMALPTPPPRCAAM